MKFRDADDCVRAWWQAENEALGPKVIGDGVMMRGHWFARACRAPRCQSTARDLARAKGGGFRWRCRRCGAVWHTVATQVLRGAVQTSMRVDTGSAALIRAVELGQVLERMPQPDAATYGLWLRLGTGFDDAARKASADPFRAVCGGGVWHGRDVRRAVRRSRAWLEAELAARDWLVPRERLAGNSKRLSGGGV